MFTSTPLSFPMVFGVMSVSRDGLAAFVCLARFSYSRMASSATSRAQAQSSVGMIGGGDMDGGGIGDSEVVTGYAVSYRGMYAVTCGATLCAGGVGICNALPEWFPPKL